MKEPKSTEQKTTDPETSEPETKSLPENAYQPLKPGETYTPDHSGQHVSAGNGLRAILWGVFFCVIFTVASAYSALKVGQGMEASIPISILAIGLARIYKRRSSLLENVITHRHGRRFGRGGRRRGLYAARALHPSPQPHPFATVFICLAGGCLGVLFVIPLRRFFVREMHGQFPFPEATAITEVLVTGERGGSQAKLLLQATCIAGALRLLCHHVSRLARISEPAVHPHHAHPCRSRPHGLQLRRHRIHPRPRLRDGPAQRHGLLRRRHSCQLRSRPADLVPRQPREYGRLSRNHARFRHDRGANLLKLRALHRRRRHRHGGHLRRHQVAARHCRLLQHRAARLPVRGPPINRSAPIATSPMPTILLGIVVSALAVAIFFSRFQVSWTVLVCGPRAHVALCLLLCVGGRERHRHHGQQSRLRHDHAHRHHLFGGAGAASASRATRACSS